MSAAFLLPNKRPRTKRDQQNSCSSKYQTTTPSSAKQGRAEIDHARFRDYRRCHPPGAPPTSVRSTEPRTQFLPPDPLAGREQGQAEEEDVVTWVKTVPERADEVRDDQVPVGAGIHVPS